MTQTISAATTFEVEKRSRSEAPTTARKGNENPQQHNDHYGNDDPSDGESPETNNSYCEHANTQQLRNAPNVRKTQVSEKRWLYLQR